MKTAVIEIKNEEEEGKLGSKKMIRKTPDTIFMKKISIQKKSMNLYPGIFEGGFGPLPTQTLTPMAAHDS